MGFALLFTLIISGILLFRDDELRYLMVFAAFQLIPYILFADWVFKGIEKMGYSAVFYLLYQGIALLFVIVLVHNRAQVLLVPWCRFIGMGVSVVYLLYALTKYYPNLKYVSVRKLIFYINSVKHTFKVAMPFVASVVVIHIYYSFDTIMLGSMRTMAEVGIYNAAYKFILLFTVIGGILQMAFAPSFSRMGDKIDLGIVGKFSWLICVIVLFAGIFLSAFSHDLVIWIYGGEYIESAKVLLVLVVAMVFICLDTIYLAPLLYHGGEKQYLMASSAGCLINIILNLVLIPRHGMYGAAFATVISNFCVYVIGFSLFAYEAKDSRFMLKEIYKTVPVGMLAIILAMRAL